MVPAFAWQSSWYGKFGGVRGHHVANTPDDSACPGKWMPVETGPWYRCECGEVQP